MENPPPATPQKSPTIQPQKPSQEPPVFKPAEEPKGPKNKLVPLLIFLLLAALGVAGYFGWQNYQLRLEKKVVDVEPEPTPVAEIDESGKNILLSLCSDLSKTECERLAEYHLKNWLIKKERLQPNYKNYTMTLLMPVVDFNVEYSIAIDTENKKIYARLPNPSVFEKILKETINDDKLNSLLEQYSLMIPNTTRIWDRDDYFVFDAHFNIGSGGEKRYLIKFSESGEILSREETKPHWPGPL